MPIATFRYFSEVLAKHCAADLILPNTVFEPPYHVMFLLHGLSDDHTGWSRRTSIERYCDNLPWIVVMPDGGRGFYTNAREGYAFETAIAEELAKIIERHFKTRPGWAATGLSMGGYGAVKLALKYPQRFISAVSHSGALHFSHLGSEPLEGYAKELDRIVPRSEYGGEDDLFVLASQAKHSPALRIDCGTADHLIEINRDFHAHLTKIGMTHEYEEFPGEHNWSYWDEHVQNALRFHEKVWSER